MLNQTAATVNRPLSLNLAGTAERVAFVFAKTRRKIDDLLTVAPNLDAEPLKNNALQLVKVARVAFWQNNNNNDAARALSLVDSALDTLNKNGAVVETLDELRANLDAITNPETVETTEPETTTEPAETVEENNVEEVEENNVEEVEEIDDDDDETSDDDDAEETTEEKERAFELVAASTVESLRRGVVPWRHLSSDTKTAPRSWDRLRPYSLNNTLIIESTPETRRARLLITFDRADVKDDDGKSVIDWTQYDDAGADIWQPKKFRVIPIKDDAGNIIKDDDGKILVTRKVSKYGKVTIHDADLFHWLEKKRAQKYAQLERIVASEIKERDAKRAALLGAAPEKWADNLAQIVKRFFDGTKLTTERAALGQEIARAFIASRLGFDLEWNANAEKKDAARLLALCTQGDKKRETTGHALQVVLKHVNKCVASILYQSQPTAIKPREEKPAPALTVEEKQRDARADEIEDQMDAIKRQWAPEKVPTSLF